MARKKDGQVVQRIWKGGRGYALRFLAYNKRQYVTLGLETEGWTRARAQDELMNIMADVRRGIWIPPDRNSDRREHDQQNVGDAEAIPTFQEFAITRLEGREGEVSPRTLEYEKWAVTHHLLPYFAHYRLDAIDVEAVDDYRRSKVAEGERRRRAIERGRPLRAGSGKNARILRPLAATTINKTIEILQAILALAVEYRHIRENPAAGRRRRLKPPNVRPVHLDGVNQIQAMLDAADALDRRPRYRMNDRRAMIATLIFAGLRAHELCQLLWRDVDLASGRIHVGRSKTQAGLREIDLLPILRDVLATHKAASYRCGPDDLVFPTGTGGMREKDNLRNRVLEPVLGPADDLLVARGQQSLPRGVRPHKLRHTFASILVACGVDPASVMSQLGHTDPKFTLRIYTHLMRRDPGERARLKALVYGEPLDGARTPPVAAAA